jgi:hypothetical protein
MITMSPDDDQPMPTDEDIRDLHAEIKVKTIMYDALRAAANAPIPGLPLSPRAAATVRKLLRRS